MSDSISENSFSDQLLCAEEQLIWRFSPNQTDPKILEAIFVGREPLLQNVLEKIDDSAVTGSTHHVLLYGPRGIGKSHFTSLLRHRLSKHETLNRSVHVAWLNEDETTTSMVQLLVRIYRALCNGYPGEYSNQWLDELLNLPNEEIATVLTRRLVARFENRKLVLLVENLNLLFENLGTEGQHELRTLLQEQPFACLIATCQQLFKSVTDRAEPFFGFFQQIPLKPLSPSDAHQLLVKIAQAKGQMELSRFLNTPDGRGRVRAIHDLAGGNHRIYIILGSCVTPESLDQLVVPFQKMADDLTPYYQERLRGISPQQRQVVELLCRQHGTVNPKEIARQLIVDQRSIGKQVRILENIGYLKSIKRGRETYYELSEPLMRLACEVKEKHPLRLLIEFLRIWYQPDEIQRLQTVVLSQTTRTYLHAAWELSQSTPDPRLKLLQEEIDRAEADGRLQEALNCYDKAVQLNPELAGPRFNRAKVLFELRRWDEGFEDIRAAFQQSRLEYLGDVASMFALIFRFSDNFNQLQSRIGNLVDLYQYSTEVHALRKPNQRSEPLGTSIETVTKNINECAQTGTSPRSVWPKENPLSHLGDGLVKSLGKIDATRVTAAVLESYFVAVEQRASGLAELEIPLRLFRYGIRYLISGKESEFVELIQPERSILRQAFGLREKSQ